MQKLFFAAALCALVALSGCRPKCQPVRTYADSTATHRTAAAIVRDTLRIIDSSAIDRRGDTIRITRTLTRERVRTLRDTVTLHDTRTELRTVEVAAPLTPWQRLCTGAFPWLAAALLLWLVLKLRRR